jgi:hypothetical protein
MESIKFYDFNSISWNMEDIENLDWKFIDTFGINTAFDSYTHERYRNVIGNDAYFLPNPMPSFVNEIFELSFLKKYTIKASGFHRFLPGMILPLHVDTFNAFSETYNIDDKSKITRYIFFLEDSKPGHMIQIDNKVFNNWQEGDFVNWTGNIPHAAYNLGTENRYTLQITCYE